MGFLKTEKDQFDENDLKVEANSDPTWPGVISLRLCSQCIIFATSQSCSELKEEEEEKKMGFFLWGDLFGSIDHHLSLINEN